MPPLDYQQKRELITKAAELFSPRTPISHQDLFAGRRAQVMKTVAAIRQPGAHAIIYGERGVGKTSLANVASIVFELEATDEKIVIAPRINCDATDQYDALWKKVFAQIQVIKKNSPMSFRGEMEEAAYTLLDEIGDAAITPGTVQRVLTEFGQHCHLIVILDEFDRLPDGDAPRLVADTIKSLSDNAAPTKIIVVGVGDSVSNLVRGHESVKRHLVEVPLPRMSRPEVEKIVNDRLPQLSLTIEEGALALIALLSRGLPYYTHLLGQHAASAAVDSDSGTISKDHVRTAMSAAVKDCEREMQRVYYESTKSRQPGSFFEQSLAACALAPKDEFGYFSAADVRGPMNTIRGRSYNIANFVGHLDRFADKAKGGIMQQSGEKHSRRYRFTDPLMEPFVVIKSLADKTITVEHLKEASQEDQYGEA